MKDEICRSCIDCAVTRCDNRTSNRPYPAFCVSKHVSDAERKASLQQYLTDEEDRKLAQVAAGIESDGYRKWPRVQETILFAKRMGYHKIGIATWLFSRVGGFPVSRGTADMKLIRRARAMLQRGECVLIYPEGTRVKDDADAEVHGGYALMAQMAKAPVQPVAVIGARNLRFRSRVWLRAGRPVEWAEIDAPKRREQVAKMEEVGMGRVFELRDELRQAHPGLE